jgi:hypothetical protein
MNGGFLDSFSATVGPLDRVLEAFNLLGLTEAAGVIAEGIALVPGVGQAPADVRHRMIDALDEVVADQLEELGHRYEALVSDALLGRRIDALARPARALPDSIEGLLREYVDTLVRRDEAMDAGKVAAANRLFDRNRAVMKALRDTSEGREGIWALREDQRKSVRSVAVTHSLQWRPDDAVRILERMDRDGDFEAHWTLKEWRAGKLRFNR